MAQIPDRLQPNAKEVAAKVIDDEAILINLSTAVYYSMDGTGGRIWSLIEERHDLDTIAATLASEYAESPDRCRADLETLAAQLIEENLVLPAEDGPADGGPAPMRPTRPYTTPQLNVYRDMGDLLALDPPVPGLEPIPWDDPEPPR